MTAARRPSSLGRRTSRARAAQRPRAGRVWVLLGLLSACSASAGHVESAGAPPPATSPPDEVERYFPLRDGDVLRYLVWLSGSSEPEQAIFQIERSSPTHASLRAGSSIKRLELAAGGVRLLSGGYLLKAPLELGAEWAGASGRVRITSVAESVSVSAGRFEGCLVTTEGSGPDLAQRAIVTTYCPDVGIVSIQVDGDGGRERFELESFGPGVDIGTL